MPRYDLMPKVGKGWGDDAPGRVTIANLSELNPTEQLGTYVVKQGGNPQRINIPCGTTENWLPHGEPIAFQNVGLCPLRLSWQ
jgi:hypothetical protein